MIVKSLRRTLTLTAILAVLAGCCASARSQEIPSSPDSRARDLAAEIHRMAGGNGEDSLGEWTRGVIEGALDRAEEAARQTVPGSGSGAGPGSPGRPTVPLPAERHAGGLAAVPANPESVSPGSRSGAGTAELLIFTSLSVPAASWRQWAHEAARMGAPLVLRGVGEGGLRATVKQIGARLGGAEAGVAIDPRLFRLFGIERVPAVVVVPGGVPPCRSRGCADDPPPPHDRVSGNIGLAAALEAVADEGAAGRNAARVHLRRLRGEERP